MALRALQGALESSISPAFLIITSGEELFLEASEMIFNTQLSFCLS
jgi:hypothetical protein